MPAVQSGGHLSGGRFEPENFFHRHVEALVRQRIFDDHIDAAGLLCSGTDKLERGAGRNDDDYGSQWRQRFQSAADNQAVGSVRMVIEDHNIALPGGRSRY